MAAVKTDAGASHAPNNKWRLYGAGLLLVILLLVLFFWLFSSLMGESVRDLLVQARDHYEEKHENIPALAKSLETADAAVEFTATKIAVSLYEDRLQTPEEVLKTRTANPADKAMFLKALLQELKVETTAKASAFPEDARPFMVVENAVEEKAMPEALRKLMGQIGYRGDDVREQITKQLGLVIDNLKEARSLTDQALERAKKLVNLDGRSSAQPAYLDWVWLEDANGKIYDPILPGRERPETFRSYNESAAKSRFSLSAVNAYGETREMVAWEGNPFGKPVSLTFVPAIDTAGRLAGDPDMSDVAVWAPILSVGKDHRIGAAVNREGDVAPKALIDTLVSEGKAPSFTAPKVSSFNIHSIDVSTWPRIKLALKATVEGQPLWHGSHFSVSIADRSPQARIEQPYSSEKNVILVADQSGSTLENDYHQWIKEFGRTLVDGLSSDQRFAVATFGYDPVFHKLFDSASLKGYPKTVYENAWKQPVRGQVDFIKALDHALNAILIELGPNPEEKTEIILATDGKAGRFIDDEWTEMLQKVRERAKKLNASISPVIVGASEDIDLADLARDTGGKLIRITAKNTIQATATSLSNELAGGMVISFKMPPKPQFEKGSVVPLTLALEGFEGTVSSKLTVPETITQREPGIYLNVSSGNHTTSRPIIALGENYDVQQMIGRTNVFLAAGQYNSNQVIAGRLDNWVTYFDIKAENEKTLSEAAKNPKISVAEMQTVNGLSNAVEFGLSTEQNTRFPLLVVKRSSTKKLDVGNADQVAILNDLDVPAWVPLTANAATKSEVAAAGFLLNDAEARFNNAGENLTKHFVEADRISDEETTDRALNLLANSSLKSASDSHLYAHSTADNLFWHVRKNTGQWRGFGLWDGIPLKGSRDVEIAAQFANIQTAIGAYNYSVKQSAGLGAALTGAQAAAAMPAAVALGGLIALKSEELKLWCYSTIMLGYVNESIAGEKDAILDKSAKAAEGRAAKLCKMDGGPQDFGKNAFKAAAKAFFDEWANQHEIPQAEDPTANLRDAYDKAQRIYKHYFPDQKKGETPEAKDRLQMLIGALDKFGNGDGPSLQTQLVDKAFKWGASSFSPSFRSNLSKAIIAEVE